MLGKRLSNALFSMSLISIEITDKTERLHELKEIVKKFHPVNYDVFKYVITHLNRFSIFLLKFCLICNNCKKDCVSNNELTARIENFMLHCSCVNRNVENETKRLIRKALYILFSNVIDV